MKRNLEAFSRGEPKMVNFEGHDPRLISNPALCDIYGVLVSEQQRLLMSGRVDGADGVDGVIDKLVIILRERVLDCYDAEFFKRHEGVADES